MAVAGLFLLFCVGMTVLIIRVAGKPQPSTADLPQVSPPPPPNHSAELYVFVVAFAFMGIGFLVPFFRANRWQVQVNAAMPRIYDVWRRAGSASGAVGCSSLAEKQRSACLRDDYSQQANCAVCRAASAGSITSRNNKAIFSGGPLKDFIGPPCCVARGPG